MSNASIRRLSILLVAAVLVVGLLVGLAPLDQALAQPPARGGGQPPGMFPMMPMMPPMMSVPAIAVANNFVYVVQDGTLYKFDADTLELVKQNTFIERPQPPGPPPFEPLGPGGGMPPPQR